MSAAYATTWDAPIRAAASEFLPQWHWLWLKAQLAAESALDPTAVSPAGAQGIAQFMPATWNDVRAALRLPRETTPFDAPHAIRGAAWYLAMLRRQWRSPRGEDDRRRLAQASYNAGLGSLVEAQERAGGATAYAPIAACLHEITGADDARQTRDYVARIERIHRELAGV